MGREAQDRLNNLKGGFIQALRWLIPGLGVKRWLIVTLAGTTLIGIGVAILVLDIYRTATDTWWLSWLGVI